MKNRTILHLDLDTFFVSVERLNNPGLSDMPVIVGGLSDRGVVAGCSYETRKFGVHSAMPMKMARSLCPEAIVIRGDMEAYSKYSDMVTEIIAEQAPVYEKASIDEHYLDISGLDRFFGCLKWSHELRQTIMDHTGLPISFGLSVNKTVSKIAAGEAKPNGELQVPYDNIKSFMDPLSIRKIPMVGIRTYQLLRSMGIANIGTLSRIPPEMMEQVLGNNGLVIWKKANGIDPNPVSAWSEQKSMSSEQTFEKDTTDTNRLNDLLVRMVEQLAFELRKNQKMTACVTVKIRYSNYDTHTLQKRIPYTAFDHVLIDVAKELFRQLYTRRMLIRLIGVRFTKIIGGTYQMNMFEDTAEMISLYQSLDRIRKRFGDKSIRRAVGMGGRL